MEREGGVQVKKREGWKERKEIIQIKIKNKKEEDQGDRDGGKGQLNRR